jgi:hypothetical protein
LQIQEDLVTHPSQVEAEPDVLAIEDFMEHRRDDEQQDGGEGAWKHR